MSHEKGDNLLDILEFIGQESGPEGEPHLRSVLDQELWNLRVVGEDRVPKKETFYTQRLENFLALGIANGNINTGGILCKMRTSLFKFCVSLFSVQPYGSLQYAV